MGGMKVSNVDFIRLLYTSREVRDEALRWIKKIERRTQHGLLLRQLHGPPKEPVAPLDPRRRGTDRRQLAPGDDQQEKDRGRHPHYSGDLPQSGLRGLHDRRLAADWHPRRDRRIPAADDHKGGGTGHHD